MDKGSDRTTLSLADLWPYMVQRDAVQEKGVRHHGSINQSGGWLKDDFSPPRGEGGSNDETILVGD